MKLILLSLILVLTGCSSISEKDKLYYDASKSISKDQTIVQSACWAAVGEIAKSGDNAVKIGAISLAEKCKTDPVKIEAPKKAWYGL